MVAHAGAAVGATNPHVRQIDPWRDGRAVANLLESAFRDEIIDDNGQRLIHALRYYGAFEALNFGLGTGFVWVEDGAVVSNASVQRNLTRKDTWIVGNVATQAEFRNRGIGRAVVEACMGYAVSRGARYVALQADVINEPALHLYQRLGFERIGEVTHYLRSPLRGNPLLPGPARAPVRQARWSDASALLTLSREAIPEAFGFAEPFDAGIYRLGLRWSLSNALGGNASQWSLVDGDRTMGLAGAVRTRVNFDGSNHHLELMLSEAASADVASALVAQGLARFEHFVSKPIYAAQPRPYPAVHAALCEAGFHPTRTLAHMRVETR